MKQEFFISVQQDVATESTRLSLRIGENHVGFAVTDCDTNELCHLAWFTGETVTADTLETLLQSHATLTAGHKQVTVCYDYPQSLIIPLNLYKDTDARAMLETTHGIMEHDELLSDRIPAWQVVNTYAVGREIRQWVSSSFRNASQVHQYSVSIRNVAAAEEEGYLLVDFRSDDFTVIVLRNNELMLAQSFPYSSPSDVVYYLLKAAAQFGLQPETARLLVSGMVDRQSILYRELYQYFVNIGFREAAWKQPEDERYPSHFFTSLNDVAR